ncbi:MAG: alpha-amylase, partial [Cyanobacteria bacterium]|nr:alpha-amylase [Cyanobacteriota bacterium]
MTTAVLEKTETRLEAQSPRYLSEVDLTPRGRVFPSPRRWKDQILYQILPDRFSDGQESTRPVFDPSDPHKYQTKDKGAWMSAGTRFVGGTLKGIISKLDYLRGLGVTGLWLNPPWKQRKDLQTYHGYGIQNFLEIDPRFGTRQDLRDLVDGAHDRGMYVILDVIFNHTGNNFFYRGDNGEPRDTMPYRYAPPHDVLGWRSGDGQCLEQPLDIEDGIWPAEFQDPTWYTRAGEIGHWAQAAWEDSMSPDVEFRRGDFYDLKDLDLSHPEVMEGLIKVYQYWISLTDCDGFRMDALKHVPKSSSRQFCASIWQFAQSIGKDNFLLTGEITDSHMILDYMEMFGHYIDTSLPVALDIVSAPNQITGLIKGLDDAIVFFSRFSEQRTIGRYLQLGGFHVNVDDDHDMSSRGFKRRFAANNDLPVHFKQSANLVAL